MNKIKNYIICSLLVFLNCCGQNIKKKDKITINNEFDISLNDSTILFACYIPQKSISIYEMPIEGGRPKLIIKSDSTFCYCGPKYSADGKKIVFIKIKKDSPGDESLCIANSDGTNIEQITNGGEILSSPKFSKFYKDEILYVKAANISKHSPIGVRQPHNMDIYSINYKTKKVRQISQLDSYNISKFSEIDSNIIVMGMMGGEDGGVFLFQRNKPDTANRFEPKNKPRAEANMYYIPSYSKICNSIAFTAPYELYTMNINTMEAVLLYRYNENQIADFCFFKTKKRLLFLRGGDTIFMAIDNDRDNLEKIPIIWDLSDKVQNKK